MKLPLIATAFALTLSGPALAQDKLLNVSYDIARELFEALNPVFAKKWQADTGRSLTIDMSHGGSSRQARAILEGLPADVVTFNQETDVDVLAEGGLLPQDWRDALPNGASPYYSLPAFLVREGNPKGIEDWDDLARDDVAPVFPNPKTSGNARYTYLAAYAYALAQNGGDQAAAQEFVRAVFDNVPVFDTGGRAATQTFAERGIGDVLVTFEAEVELIENEFGKGQFEQVNPSVSIETEAPVALVDKVTAKKGTAALAKAYLDFHWTPEAQEIIAKNNFRPRDPAIFKKHAQRFANIKLFTVEQTLGGWAKVSKQHFADGGSYDQIVAGIKR